MDDKSKYSTSVLLFDNLKSIVRNQYNQYQFNLSKLLTIFPALKIVPILVCNFT